jgi:hypothetical protein
VAALVSDIPVPIDSAVNLRIGFETMLEFAKKQGLTEKPLAVEDLFIENTRNT